MATDSIDAGVREAGLALAIEPFALLTNTRMVSFLYYGRRYEAVAELNRLLDDAKAGGNVSHYALAVIHAGLGSKDAAFAELESAYAERAWSMLLLKRDPAFDSLRGNPRFRAARTKSGARIVTSVRRAKLADAAIYHR